MEFYYRLPVIAQELALSAYGLRLRWLRHGRQHRQESKALEAYEGLSRERTALRHDAAICSVLEHASRHVPFYRNRGSPSPTATGRGSEALREWPILSKAEVQAAGNELIADTHRNRRLSTIHTGGTTGRALAIRCDRAALQRNYAFFSQVKRWAVGTGPVGRVATFAGRPIVSALQRRPPYWRRNFAAGQILFSSYHLSSDTLEDYVRALEHFSPTLIDSYPSSLEPIARHIIERGGISHSPTAVITSSETLFPEVRELIQRAFGCRVFDHYGSAEMVAWIAQCEFGRYHPNPDYGALEIVRSDGSPTEPGEEGEIVATGFINRAMPLVRYRMGDLGYWIDERCPCDRPFSVVGPPVGRMDDVIVTPDGRRVGRIDPIFKSVEALHEARLVQTSLDHVRLEIVPGPAFSPEHAESLSQQLGLRLGPDVRIEIVRVSSLPRTERGKLRTVVSPFGRRAMGA
jgi:phenylacetate-CoA ligase